MEKKLRWGIIGTGAIARKFARGLAESKHCRLVAAGSRTAATVAQFTREFPCRGHASYDALLADPEVEVVYIATPHPSHMDLCVRAAQAGKHIVCEKPLAMNATEAETAIAAARGAGVFLMEAFMYRCHPQTARVLELIRDGAIGRVHLVQAEFSFRADWKPEGRLLNRALGGGGILDVGCYCTSMARLVAGVAVGDAPFHEPVEFKAMGHLGETGVDEIAVALLRFPGGMLAQLATGVRLNLENRVRIWGEEGHIVIPTPWIVGGGGLESVLQIHRAGEATRDETIRVDRSLYAIEADTVAEAIGGTESTAMSWADSLGNMRVLDQWRAKIGLNYPGE